MIDSARLERLIGEAERGVPALSRGVLSIQGYSTHRVRRLLNALCSEPDANYLEIGVHVGSTFIPALYENEARATCIDNWSLFGNKRDEFEGNLRRLLPNRSINLIEADCFTVNLASIPPHINTYFYDADHSQDSQYKALTYYAPVLDDSFVLVVDDMNWPEPREGTMRAIKHLAWRVEDERTLPGPYNGGDSEAWWNGLYVALVHKR